MSILGNSARKLFLSSEQDSSSNIRIQKTERKPFIKSLDELINPVLKAPLTSAQQRIWFQYELNPHHITSNLPVGFRMKGELDQKVLEKALQILMQRHQILQTTFSNNSGQLIQRVSSNRKIPVQVISFSHLPVSQADEALNLLIDTEARRPFDLEKGPLFRPFLVKLHPAEHVLFLVIHNIIFDHASIKIMLHDLAAIYNSILSRSTQLQQNPPIQYTNYARWEQELVNQPHVIKQLAYWKEKLSGELPVLEIPADKLRPAIQRYKGATHSIVLPENIAKSLKEVARNNNVSLYTTLLASFYTLLYRYSGQEDIIVGAPIYNRNLAGSEGLIGLFKNILALRQQINGEYTFIELLQIVQQNTTEAFQNKEIPFEKIVEEINPERTLSRPPVYQVLFQLHNETFSSLQTETVSFENYPLRTGITDFDLFLDVHENKNTLTCFFEYDVDLFNASTIERMASHYVTLIASIVTDPHQKITHLTILPQAERKLLLTDWNNTQTNYPQDMCAHQLFEQQVAQNPSAIAIDFEGTQLTYHELNEKAGKLANYLVSKGVQQDTLVPLCMNRSLEMIVGIMGILKAGAAFVPVDPAFPKDRIQFMLEDAASAIVVSASDCVYLVEGEADREVILLDKDWALIDDQPETKADLEFNSQHLAYAIFTSGSTGRPKGVMIQHQSLVNFLFSMIDRLNVPPAVSLLSVTTFSFDIFYLELFMPLLVGGKVILASRETASDGYLLQKKMEQHRPAMMQATPASWQMLVDSGWKNKENITVLLGGEAIREALKETLTGLSPKVWNLYGPTETTIWSTCKELKAGEKITIGKPIANTRIYILDKAGNPVSVGVPGELCIGGDGLARGYLKRADLTAEKFTPDAFSNKHGAKVYRTGDLARWLANGELEYISRLDDQVKIRGYRIELGEIENILQQCAAVRKGVVVARTDTSGSKRLVGYVIPEGRFDKESILAELRIALPEYMVPSVLVALEAFPLTPNGKVNKKALPDPKQLTQTHDEYVAPATEAEQILAEIWAQLLSLERVGRYDNFFELGGHSLLAIKLIAEIRNRTGKELPVSILYSHPVIAKLAKHTEGETTENAWDSLVPIRTGKAKLPVYFIHHGGGNIEYAQRLTPFLDSDQPVYGIQPIGLNGTDTPLETIEAMAQYYTELILANQPVGPYHLGGYSTGGLVAYQIAKNLTESGNVVGNLIMLDRYPKISKLAYHDVPLSYILLSLVNMVTSFTNIKHFYQNKGWVKVSEIIKGGMAKIDRSFLSKLRKPAPLDTTEYEAIVIPHPALLIRKKMLAVNISAEKRYQMKSYQGTALFIRASDNPAEYVKHADFGWHSFATAGVDVYEVGGNHDTLFDETENVKKIAAIVQKHLNRSNNPLINI